MQLPKALLKDCISAHMDGQVLPPDPLVQPLQLRSEVAPLDIKVQHPGVVDQDAEGPVCQVSGRLSENLVQHRPVGFREL